MYWWTAKNFVLKTTTTTFMILKKYKTKQLSENSLVVSCLKANSIVYTYVKTHKVLLEEKEHVTDTNLNTGKE